MTLSFSARIEGNEIHCDIGSDVALSAPVFCFSLMAQARVISGGTLTRSIAGYAEVTLPDLAPGQPARLVLAHLEPGFRPVNRAWLPLGGYLRVAGQTLPLPELPAGVQAAARPAAAIPPDTLRLIPQPSEWQPTGGSRAFTALAPLASLVAVEALARRLSLAPLCAPAGEMPQLYHSPDLPPEAYVLTITPQDITIAAASDHGIYNAAITLLNLRETYGNALPCGTLTDAPRFVWRGQHLDCARHFYSVATILRLLDLMALLKLNRFHWHFADDEAFRLQVDTAPDLWQKSAFRGEGCAVPGVFGGGIRSGGSYSRADVETVLTHAQALHIQVLPEIEVPAHAFALNRAVPGLRDPADTGRELSIQAYGENIVNPAMPATWQLLEPLALEIAAMFPIGMLHLGCDELPPGAWQGSPAVAALKAREGLQSSDDVQGWMMQKLAAFLAGKGIRAAAWEEAAKGGNGGIGNNALLFSWTGQGPGIEAARRGHDVVMCPAQHIYFDMAHSGAAADWGAAWAAFVDLDAVVNWKPVPQGAEDIAHRIVGIEGCFWSEFTTADAQIEPMLAPRILGLANKAWDCRDSLTGAALRVQAAAYAPVFARIGWLAHPGA